MSLRERCEEAALGALGACSCHDDYSARDRTDPNCIWCNYHDEVKDALEGVALRERELTIAAMQRILRASERDYAWIGDRIRSELAK